MEDTEKGPSMTQKQRSELLAKLQAYAQRDEDENHSLFPSVLFLLASDIGSLLSDGGKAASQLSDIKSTMDAQHGEALEKGTFRTETLEKLLLAVDRAKFADVRRHRQIVALLSVLIAVSIISLILIAVR